MGIVSAVVDASHRISIPSRFREEPPYFLLAAENEAGETIRVVCSVIEKEIFETNPSLRFRVEGKKNGHRFTLPNASLKGLGVHPGERIVFLGMGSYLEIWSWEKFNEDQARAMQTSDSEQ